jgi:hypothetical protein
VLKANGAMCCPARHKACTLATAVAAGAAHLGEERNHINVAVKKARMVGMRGLWPTVFIHTAIPAHKALDAKALDQSASASKCAKNLQPFRHARTFEAVVHQSQRRSDYANLLFIRLSIGLSNPVFS